MAKIELLSGWKCRPRQDRLWHYLNNGGKRAAVVWHRRYGKDDVALRWAAVSMMRRPASYWHMLPMKDQARTAIWDAVNPHTGKRRIDEAFHDKLFEKRDTDMLIRCRANDATWQVKGSDNYGAGIGSSPAGIVFSEYSRADPNAWAFLRPILKENNGWALFISTPFGHNHFENMYRYAISEAGVQDGWFGELLTVEDTGLFTKEQIAQELRELAAERGSLDEAQSVIDQEYYCSFDAAIPGAIYSRILADMEAMDPPRIAPCPHDPGFDVECWSDLGATEGNDMAVIFTQKVGRETRIIDCDSDVGVGIDWLAEKLNQRARDRKFVYAPTPMIFPHDAAHPQASNRGAASFAQKFAQDYHYRSRVNPVTHSIAWSIDQTKHFLKTCIIDTTHCGPLLAAMRNYHRKWDPVRRTYSDKPVHDWSSNFCDAMRTGSESRQRDHAGQARRTRVPYAALGLMTPSMRNDNMAVDYDDPLGR